MSMDLVNAGGELRLNTYFWDRMLQLGIGYGWEPEGTIHKGSRIADLDGEALLSVLEATSPNDGEDFGSQIEREHEDIETFELFARENWVTREIFINGGEPEDASMGDVDDNYQYPQGQTVKATDASNLAIALEKSLDDIPDHDALQYREGGEVQLIELFSGKTRKTLLRDFIAFARQGEFSMK